MATNDTNNILGVSIEEYSDETPFEDNSGKALSATNLNRIEDAIRSILGYTKDKTIKQPGYLDEILSAVNTALTNESSAREQAVSTVHNELNDFKIASDERFVKVLPTYDLRGGSATALHKPELE